MLVAQSKHLLSPSLACHIFRVLLRAGLGLRLNHQLAVPSHRLSMCGRRAFAIAGPTTGIHRQQTFVMWRTAPLHLDDYLRLICFLSTSIYSALGVSAIMRYINQGFIYLLNPIRRYYMSVRNPNPTLANCPYFTGKDGE